MTIDVAEDSGRHRAIVPFEDTDLPCCTAGHPDEAEAVDHAVRLTAALERKTRTGGTL